MPEQWSCLNSATGTDCIVTQYATSTQGTTTATSTPYNGPSFDEWLLAAAIIIFYLSLLSWRVLFQPAKEFLESL